MHAMSALEKIEKGLKSAKIEITPEVVEVGRAVYAAFDARWDDEDVFVENIFRRLLMASRQFGDARDARLFSHTEDLV